MKPTILIVGMGRLGTALSQRLSEAGYRISKSRRRSQPKYLRSHVVWFCVPDAEVSAAAKSYSSLDWRGKYAFHSSGVLTSDALAVLRNAGAAVGSVHPLMTFVKGSVPELDRVPFAIEGDKRAAAIAQKIVRDLGGVPVRMKKKDKVAYHAFATMICPLLVSLLAASEKTSALAGILDSDARHRMMPIIGQTLRNYEKLGPSGAFSGPIVRGDVETIRAHLKALAQTPAAQNAYVALAQAALEYLPNQNRREMVRLFVKSSRP